MPPARDSIDRLRRLRDLFLRERGGDAPLRDYWRDDADLRAYAEVLGERIGWKWDAALAECRARGLPRADDAVVLDFGCGTGVAAQRFAATFGAREVLCHDRSAAAMAFAAHAVAERVPGVAARPCPEVGALAPDVLLASHVLGELDDRGRHELTELVLRSRCVVLVEPSDRATSRRLGALRDRGLGAFAVVAPCPHRAGCPALATEGDWCHFFAPPPQQVFTDGAWVRTARELGIDLRALPYSFVALVRADAAAPATGGPAHRVLGRAEVRKHDALLRLCVAGSIAVRTVTRRGEPELHRALGKGALPRELPPPP